MKKINIIYTLTAPVSHIGETASTGSYFQTINTSNGRLPVITGNSVRGTLRDCAAKHLLNSIGSKVDKETFNVLFSGGNITGSTKNDVGRAKLIREHFPMVSLFGGGLGTMIMAGTLASGFMYPICSESEDITGIESEESWHNMIDEIEFTRMDDSKNDVNEHFIEDIEEEKKAKASTQMRFSVQYLSAGTKLIQQIILLDTASEMEEAALYSSLATWFECPTIGGMRSKGFGTFNAESEEISVNNGKIEMSERVKSLIEAYENFIAGDCSAEWLYLLKDGGKK